MNKILKGLMIILLLAVTKKVDAANYNLKELIPINTKTTIVTPNFSYKKLYYNQETHSIDFAGIKNISDNNLPLSISIALFGSNKKNLSIVNYCSQEIILTSKEEIQYTIKVASEDLPDDISIEDVKYIAILGDNITCRTTGTGEFVGKRVEEIGVLKDKGLDGKTQLLIQILIVVGAALIILFLYKVLFTSAYQNINGNSVRRGYDKYNKKLQKEREAELKRNPPKEKEVQRTKTEEILKQEEQAKEDKNKTALHDLYK